MEGDGLGLDFALLDVDFVAGEDDGDVFADADEITCACVVRGTHEYGTGEGEKLTMPVGNVLVGDTGCHVEHDDSALAVDVVSISETTELLLPSSIPHVELDLAQVLQYSQRQSRGRYWGSRGECLRL